MRQSPICITTLLTLLLATASSVSAQSKPLRVFILAGQSNMEGHANADGSMTAEQKREYLGKYEAKIISPAEAALWKRGASNAGYHYLGCAKTFALMGRAFAESMLTMLRD